MSVLKCEKCGSKSTELIRFDSQLLGEKEGNFCDICHQQSVEKEDKQINEWKKRNMNVSVYMKPKTDYTIPTAVPITTPSITNIYNINLNINNITNHNDNSTHIHKHSKPKKEKEELDNLDKKSAKMENDYKNILKEEEFRIQKLKEWRNKKNWYNECNRCKKNKHYSSFEEELDKDGNPIILTKLYGVENPVNEEGDPMYMRKRCCEDCTNKRKEKRQEDNQLKGQVKEQNTHKCECGGSYFLGLGNSIIEFNKLRHERTKKHLEYIEKNKLKDDVNIDFNNLKRDHLHNIFKLNNMTGYTRMNKEELVKTLSNKQTELNTINQSLILQ